MGGGAVGRSSGYDAVVVGAGVIGASVAYHLGRAGVRRVAVVERAAAPGLGSSLKAPAGFRHQFSTEVNVRLSLDSLARLHGLREETGRPVTVHREGYLVLASDAGGWRQLQAHVALQRRLGVPVETLSADAAGRLVPLVRTDGVLGAAFCALDGHGPPRELLDALVVGARRSGSRFLTLTTVTALRRRGDRVAGVETDRGPLDAPVVVLAAGAWSGALGAAMGLYLPVRPSKRTLWQTEPLAQTPARLPFVVDLTSGFLFVRRGDRLVFGLPGRPVPPDPPTFDEEPHSALIGAVRAEAARRAPLLARAPVAGAWAGPYEMTPDAQPIIDAVGAVEGLYVAAGFSGHGVMHALAVGRVVADWVTRGRVADLDLSPLSLARFGHAPIGERLVF